MRRKSGAAEALVVSSRRPSEPNETVPAAVIAGRPGFTIIELLVVVGVMGVLIALVLPAVMGARQAARRTQCKNHLRNIDLAVLNETHSKKRFPASGNFGKGSGDHHSWVVTILPYLDRHDIYREWDFDQQYSDPVNLRLCGVHVPVLVCPDDITAAGNGDLSYAVNGGFGWTRKGVEQIRGFIDLNGDGEFSADNGAPTDGDLLLRSGLFFVENWPTGSGTVRHHTVDTVRDGLSHTIMIAESIRAGYDPHAPNGLPGNWACPLAWRSSFFLSGYVCEDMICAEGNVDYVRANSRQTPYASEAINSALDQAEGEAPWASSYHGGGVHVAFCDGRVVFLSEGVDGKVYAALLSPQGTLIKGALAQIVVSGDGF